ncbi:dTDP-4-dehydrorhamnose reductase [Sphingobacterium faecium]|uniref:dTDP-4-dehydrorhamnose reductase n=1 Tax=Sphingobacterium faecium TaxID=34087 RepID=UPI003DA3DAB9
MKIIITGANGQLGSELKDILLKDASKECFFLDRTQLPLDQPSRIKDILAQYQPDLIIHAGAYTAVDLAESEPDLADIVNHHATEEIAKYCYHNKARLIAISTDYVFDGTSDSPLSEDAEVDPINIYGSTKLKGEQSIQKWLPEAVIIRTSWVYSTYGKNFVKTMIKLMTERDEISVINDQIGSPTYAYDLAKAISVIVDSKWLGGIYHYSNEGEISWYDFALAIRELQGLECKVNAIPTSSYPTPAKRPCYSLLDKSKIKRTYNLNIPTWKESLEMMLNKEKV